MQLMSSCWIQLTGDTGHYFRDCKGAKVHLLLLRFIYILCFMSFCLCQENRKMYARVYLALPVCNFLEGRGCVGFIFASLWASTSTWHVTSLLQTQGGRGSPSTYSGKSTLWTEFAYTSPLTEMSAMVFLILNEIDVQFINNMVQ